MSFDGSNIQNVSSKMYVDVICDDRHLDRHLSPGQSIIICTLNRTPSGTSNQQWRFTPVSAGRNLFTIQGVSTGLYAIVPTGNQDQPQANTEIVTGIVSMPWEITRGHALGNSITIKVPFTNLFWNLADGAIGTKITLANGDGSDRQKWTTRTTLPPCDCGS